MVNPSEFTGELAGFIGSIEAKTGAKPETIFPDKQKTTELLACMREMLPTAAKKNPLERSDFIQKAFVDGNTWLMGCKLIPLEALEDPGTVDPSHIFTSAPYTALHHGQ